MATYNNKKKTNSTSSSNKPLTSAQALKNYNNVQSKKPASFSYNDKQLQKLYNDAMNRKDFSFDLNGNAFYNQYKDKFTKQGQLAMADTVGQVAAASGGYGNSYAQTAGQQVYQNNLDQLSDIVPDLYNLAFQQYQYEGQQLQDKYAMATDKRDFAYGQYRDQVSDYQYGNDTAYNIYADTRDYEYQQSRDKVADDQWAQEFGYQKQRDKVADNQWQKTFDRGVYESDRDFNYQQSRDKVADNQWQKTFDRSVYESDRDYNRGVYESDRNYNRDVFESDRAYDYQAGRDKVTDSWNDRNYKLSQQELAETVRHNKANESYNTRSLGIDSGNPFDEDTGTGNNDWKNVKATASYDKLSSKAKQINSLFMQYSKDDMIDMVYKAAQSGEITAADAKWLFNSFGYKDY